MLDGGHVAFQNGTQQEAGPVLLVAGDEHLQHTGREGGTGEAGVPGGAVTGQQHFIVVVGTGKLLVHGAGQNGVQGHGGQQLTGQGEEVLLVAGETFGAAAADQLEIWAERGGASVVRQNEGADPASVVYDGIQSARAKDVDVIIIDTAGRLHNKANLMNELNKISRIVNRELPNAAKETLLVLDGTTGQNGLIQAKQFKEIAGVTAIALTKLDGTAKGGIVISVADALQIPVKFVGVGEQADDLMPFEAREFVEALIQE